ncbi:MAG: 30S ribosomal protein S6 [Spirochaetia bacterium]|jgi:small subunit ribosomal protein S6|nr:30S ribosomal protein S6 [Spirochaetia bacterium]
MRTYEFTVILRAEEDAAAKGKELVKKELANANAAILKEEDLGIRVLAYPIKKEEKGRYLYMELQADPAVISVIEKNCLLMNPVLKFLFVKKES